MEEGKWSGRRGYSAGFGDFAVEKTRRIEFGRFAEQNRERRGEGKPETFDFPGFTHISWKDRDGSFSVKRKTIGKRMRAKLLEFKGQLRARMHEPVAQTGKWLSPVPPSPRDAGFRPRGRSGSVARAQ